MARRIFLINNDGGGFADYVSTDDGTTIAHFFANQMRDSRPSDFLIRVNREAVQRDYVLEDNDRVSITPVKVEGA